MKDVYGPIHVAVVLFFFTLGAALDRIIYESDRRSWDQERSKLAAAALAADKCAREAVKVREVRKPPVCSRAEVVDQCTQILLGIKAAP